MVQGLLICGHFESGTAHFVWAIERAKTGVDCDGLWEEEVLRASRGQSMVGVLDFKP